jgi:hypothetical protein
MSWRHDLDALIESTTAFVQDVGGQYAPELPPVLRTVEQALRETPNPAPAARVAPMVFPASERDEIRQHVSNFKAHQQKLAQEREEYYLQTKARMMASFPSAKENPLA